MRKILISLFLTTSLFGEDIKLDKPDIKEEVIETDNKVVIDGQEIKYKAYAGTLPLKDKDNKPKGSIFFVAYFKEGVENPSTRPITYCFNGGPGCSSVFLHMGAFGPRRIEFNEQGKSTPPYEIKNNDLSILDLTDLVFIDPISTGFSRTVQGEDPKQFHGVDEDIGVFAEFIRYFSSRYGRWDSPKYIAGESYGTTRAAGLAYKLHEDEFIYLNGVVLISSILNYQTIRDLNESNDLPYILFLPSYTAAAWYHHRLKPELQNDLHESIAKAEEFAMNEYATALLKGDLLTLAEKKEIAKKLSDFTGLSEEYLLNSNLRVMNYKFTKELLRKDFRSIGRFDARFIGVESNQCAQYSENDPSFEVLAGAFSGALNQYLISNLKWNKYDSYTLIADVGNWNYGKAQNTYLNTGKDLRDVMNKNPDLKVFVASGAYDLATPYFATDYTFNHLGLDPSLRSNVTQQYYEAGHMMYIHHPSLVKLKKDLKAFYKDSE